jgi:hypothetical protein
MHRDKFITLHDHEYKDKDGIWERTERRYALVEPEYIKHLLDVCLDGADDTVMEVLEDTEIGAQLREVLDYFDQFVEWEDVKNA